MIQAINELKRILAGYKSAGKVQKALAIDYAIRRLEAIK